MIIAILNQKGGSGKTMIAIRIAAGLLVQQKAKPSRPARVLLVDADQQASALDWAAARKGAPLFPVIGLPKATLHRELPEVAADYAYTVIGWPPRVKDVAKSAILAADLVLIPIQPSPYDVSAAKEIVTLLEESPNDLEAAFIASRKIVDTAIAARRCRLPEYISLASPEGRYFAARRVRRATAPRAHRASDNRTQ